MDSLHKIWWQGSSRGMSKVQWWEKSLRMRNIEGAGWRGKWWLPPAIDRARASLWSTFYALLHLTSYWYYSRSGWFQALLYCFVWFVFWGNISFWNNLYIIMQLQEVMPRDRTCSLYSPQWLTSCKILIQCANPDIGSKKTEQFHHYRNPSCWLFRVLSPPSSPHYTSLHP